LGLNIDPRSVFRGPVAFRDRRAGGRFGPHQFTNNSLEPLSTHWQFTGTAVRGPRRAKNGPRTPTGLCAIVPYGQTMQILAQQPTKQNISCNFGTCLGLVRVLLG